MRAILSGMCFCLGAVSAAQAGVVVHMGAKGSSDGAPRADEVVYAQDGMLRIDKLDEQGHVRDTTLIRDGAVWNVNVPKRTFMKFDKNAVAAQQNAMHERMQSALQNMPPDRRAVVEERMKAMQQQSHAYTLTDAGRSEHVGTYSCQIWQASRDGKPIAEYCVAPRGSLAGGDELVAAAHKASAVAVDIFSASPQMARVMSPVYTLYGKMDGFPVLKRHVDDGGTRDETFVTGIEKKSLPADQFAIPKGFTEVTPGQGASDN
jgi:Domain of unknown function (DUF4412)